MNNRLTELLEISLGNKGSVEITDTTKTDGSFSAIYTVTDTVVSAQTDATGITNADLTAFTSIPANRMIYGRWSSITLTSGSVICYKE